MKSFLIIGIGKFGHHLCMNLAKSDCEILIVDQLEEKVEDLLPYVTNAKIGDCTNAEVLQSLGIRNFDVCFVCIAENFQSSLEITSLLSELGAKRVVSRADRDIQAKFLLRNGADEVIYPDRDIAERVGKKYVKNRIYEYFELDQDYSIYEIPPFDECIGKSIAEVNFRVKYDANIIGFRRNGTTYMMPPADYVFKEEEHLIVVGKTNKLDKIIN